MNNSNLNFDSVLSKRIIFKIILILAIILILFLIVPNFISYKKSNKNIKNAISVSEKESSNNALLDSFKEASYEYFDNSLLPEKDNDVKTVKLKKLYEKKLIKTLKTDSGKTCSSTETFSEVTKIDDYYLVKVYLKCGSDSDYIIVKAKKYSTCKNTICDKKSKVESNTYDIKEIDIDSINEDIKDEEVESTNEDKNQNQNNNQSSSNSVNSYSYLSSFSEWSPLEKANCNTIEVTCDVNDVNCLEEVRLERKKEIVSKDVKTYTTTPLVLNKKEVVSKSVCSSYNYFLIQGILYRSKGNYEEILNINKTTTANWEYQGTITTKVVPNFGGYMYYKYVKTDFSKCSDTCSDSDLAYVYDVYKYKKDIEKVTSSESCKKITKNINSYKVVKQRVDATHEENKYGEVCYKSTRTRTKY